MTLGYVTNPLKNGAPLPDEADLAAPVAGAIRAELLRAKVELMHAIARHRKAWKVMRQIKVEREEDAAKKGVPAYLDNDVHWSVAVGDVRWWREEMNAQASTVTALMAMLADRPN